MELILFGLGCFAFGLITGVVIRNFEAIIDKAKEETTAFVHEKILHSKAQFIEPITKEEYEQQVEQKLHQ